MEGGQQTGPCEPPGSSGAAAGLWRPAGRRPGLRRAAAGAGSALRAADAVSRAAVL